MLNVLGSRGLTDWLLAQNLSLAISTYQAGKLLLVGTKHDGGLAVFERTFNRCMGLWTDSQTIWMSTRYQMWRMENMLGGRPADGDFDRLYVPQVGYTTGDIEIHSGNVVHWIRIEGGTIHELYDVAAIKNPRCPKALGFKTDEIEGSAGISPLSRLIRAYSVPAPKLSAQNNGDHSWF